jgi:hypothetical protein
MLATGIFTPPVSNAPPEWRIQSARCGRLWLFLDSSNFRETIPACVPMHFPFPRPQKRLRMVKTPGLTTLV